ncbi:MULTISPECIES: DUF2637 domain-containing protein [Protofrankia]|uniref:DUF2637 domain-containing protein n=1 Tax=Candidatus Protofrankia datiscae TaxID=2716812 RepID=F8B0D2_9ACTN|nr:MULTISPECIES: DUF2637 domain-containing protein [Protofrankia]AEH08758.1 hypothetical protein FsymDg_1273 [Candidatus Protofrankia datiscae]
MPHENGQEPAESSKVSWPLIVSLVLIAGVWAAGAVWSYDHQSRFAESLGFHHGYLLPAVADGLPVAMAAVAFSAALDGRPATVARLGTALAVAASSASNGIYAWRRSGHDLTTVIVAVAIPVMAAVAFEVLLGEIRKQVLQRRGAAPPAPVPLLRPIRVLLDPFREIGQWRRHVLTVTDPAADPVRQQALSRLVDAVAEIEAQRESPQETSAEEIETSRETFEAPVWPTETPALTAPVSGETSRSVAAETSTLTASETAETSRSDTSRPSRSGKAETAGSQRAAMKAWATAQIDAGVKISGADLDRQFGTRNYGRAVLRELKAARAEAAEVAPVSTPAVAGVADA